MDSCIEHQKEIDNLLRELDEYKAQSKEYEDALEAEMVEKDLKIAELTQKLENLETDNKTVRRMYEMNSVDMIRLIEEAEALKKKLKYFEDQKRNLEDLNDQWEKSARILEYSKQELEERLSQIEEMAVLYKEEIEELSLSKEIEVQRLKDKYNDLRQELLIATVEPSKTLKAEIVTLNEVISIPSRPQSKNPSRTASRNVSNNHSRKGSLDSNGCNQSVKVVVRLRPILKDEVWDKNALSIKNSSIHIKDPKPKSENKIFEFENIVSPDQDEESMFLQISESVDSVLLGKNSCVIAYGQTGSGKTYTMNSIINKAVERLKSIENAQVWLQCIEVYNEQVKNLCVDTKEMNENHEIKLQSDWVCQVLTLIQDAILRRTTKYTDCNERSSRSHAIFTLSFTTSEFVSKIQFVDLAGSERVSKSNVVGETLKEALLINKSLSALQDVISALENKQKHVPYRNSMLTKLLQPTLGGSQSMVTMIINCSPSLTSLNETVSTLALASRVKAVDLGFFIRKNLNNKEVERTLTLLEKERAEKNSLLRTIDKLHRDLESYQFAVKDRDNKISVLNNKVRLRDKAYQEVRKGPRAEIKSAVIVKNKSGKNRDLIHFNSNEIGRVFSLSPSIAFPSSPRPSPKANEKPTRIPTPGSINLRLGSFD